MTINNYIIEKLKLNKDSKPTSIFKQIYEFTSKLVKPDNQTVFDNLWDSHLNRAFELNDWVEDEDGIIGPILSSYDDDNVKNSFLKQFNLKQTDFAIITPTLMFTQDKRLFGDYSWEKFCMNPDSDPTVYIRMRQGYEKSVKNGKNFGIMIQIQFDIDNIPIHTQEISIYYIKRN